MGIVIRKSITTSIINYIGILLGVISVLWLQTAIITELQIGILSYIVDVTILLLPLILFGTSGIPVRFLHLFKEVDNRNQFITALFIIPSSIGYGDKGAGEMIPPYSPLVFEVELLDIQ